MTDNKNTLIAIVLSAIVLLGWQYFIGMPQMEKQRQQAQQQAQQPQQAPTPAGSATPGSAAPVPGQPMPQAPGQAAPAGQVMTREAALAAGPRGSVETPRMKGSIGLKGARIDDVALTGYHETVDPKSPPIVFLSPFGTEHPFYAEFGWVNGASQNAKLPTFDTVWRQNGSGALTTSTPVTLTWDNGEGLEFRRT